MAKKTNPQIAQKDNTDVRNNKIMAMMSNIGKPVMASKKVSDAVKFIRSGKEGPGYEKNLGSLSSAQTDSVGNLAASKKIVTSKKMGGSIKKKK